MRQSVEVSTGETFDIPLEGNLTTGYHWEVMIPSAARAIVELVEEVWEPEAMRPGSPTVQRFRFRALAPGQVDLTFRYRRPWESQVAREERVISLQIIASR